MRRSLKLVSLLLVASAVSLPAQTFTIADNSSSGTYQKMLGEIIGVCSTDEFNIVEARGITGGAPGNLDALINNKAQAAFLHSDVYFANSMADPSYAKYQTLVALWPEPIHVLTLRTSKTRKNGNPFAKATFNTLADLKGYNVGAAGGGVYTAKILAQGNDGGGFSVVPYNSGDDVLKALGNGDIGAAIFVGAAPLPILEKLDKNYYKLVPVGADLASHFKGVYRDASINYNGLTNGPVRTLAPVATLLTRKYNTESKVAAQRHFRNCFYQHLDQLKDEGSPNWQTVEANDRGVLPWYDIQGSTSTGFGKSKK